MQQNAVTTRIPETRTTNNTQTRQVCKHIVKKTNKDIYMPCGGCGECLFFSKLDKPVMFT